MLDIDREGAALLEYMGSARRRCAALGVSFDYDACMHRSHPDGVA
jgi:hypothetical protein